MNRLYFMMAAIILVCGCTSDPTPDPNEETCGLQVPPEGVYPIEATDAIIFVYPKTIPHNYTGCQTIWVANKYKVKSVTHFKDGIPVTLKQYENNKLRISCEIKDKEEKQSAPSADFTCYNYSMINNMEKMFREAHPYRGEIPSGSDPRK